MKRLILLTLLFICSPLLHTTHALSIDYTLTIEDPVSHYGMVEVAIKDWRRSALNFQMPAWSPGRYKILNFAKNVRQFEATSDKGQLSTQKTDKQTWRISTRGHSDFILRYSVYANALSGEYSQINDQHAFIDGASIFGYIENSKDEPLSLKINFPANWDILSSAGDLGQSYFDFPNYDRMIDELVQLGNFEIETFIVDDIECRISILHNGDNTHLPEFVSNIKKITKTAYGMLGPLDTNRLTFFFHFLPDSRHTAGMEHLNCYQVTRNHDLSEFNTSMDWTYWIAAHEFIHCWNVKRLRPEGLGPFDYSQEVYTPLLWFGEGCTSYLADLIMVRSGLWNENKFLSRLSNNIKQFRNTPGIYERSAEQASFDTWLIEDSSVSDWNNVWINYYLKGQLIGYCMDLEIRHLTENAKSFEDFFKHLYEKQYHGRDDSYYLQGNAFSTDDLLQSLRAVTKTSWNPFYERLIAKPGDINFEFYLSMAGLSLQTISENPPLPYTGLRLESAPGGYPQIDWIEDRSPAEESGLDHFDIIIALNKERTSMNDFDDVLARQFAKGKTVEVSLLRDDRLMQMPLTLDPSYLQIDYEIKINDNRSALSQEIYYDWTELPQPQSLNLKETDD